MADLEHPIDGAVIDLAVFRNELVSEFQQNDGRISEREANLLVLLDHPRKRISRARNFEKAVALAVKQEGKFTEYTERQFALAGVKIEPLDAA